MNNPKHMVIPIFVPHEGCPFDCIFCNQKKISGQVKRMSADDIRQKVQEYLDSVSEVKYIEIGFYGGSFTGIDYESQIEYLSTAYEFVKIGKVDAIRLSTRPDFINKEILDYLKRYGVKTIELGVQSLDNEVLKLSGRGHTSEDVYKASELIKKEGFELGIQTMVGLPGDTKEKALETAQKVITINPSIVRIYPVLVVKDTMLEQMLNKGTYKPLEVNESVEICKDILKLYDKNGVNVIRIGLQPTDDINYGKELIAGPFHPAFRELVESEITLELIEKKIKEGNFENLDELIIKAPKKMISIIIGQKRSNLTKLKQKHGYKSIRIITDSDFYHIQID